jgi:4-diphosphocytidyl-2-C-methyl-D-erythritol kinase
LDRSEFVTEFAPAKINLSLHVTGQRADGYHLLESLVVFADVGDEVQISPSRADQLTINGPFGSGLSRDSGNLVAKARDQLRDQHGFVPVHIHLTKNLPVSSGIGGGSSDAAATLRALAKLFGLPNTIIADVAMGLGADVPMCLAARPLIAKGIGDQLSAVEALPELHLVLANPNVAVATPDVFKRLSNRNNPALSDLPNNLNLADFAEWLSRTRNDLQLPALQLCPEIGDTLLALAETAPMLTRMSGSGATCYGLYPDAISAAKAAQLIAARHSNWWVKPAKTGGNANARKSRQAG